MGATPPVAPEERAPVEARGRAEGPGAGAAGAALASGPGRIVVGTLGVGTGVDAVETLDTLGTGRTLGGAAGVTAAAVALDGGETFADTVIAAGPCEGVSPATKRKKSPRIATPPAPAAANILGRARPVT
jgi:hypothetical protein